MRLQEVYTQVNVGLVNQLITPVQITPRSPQGKTIETYGIWDTGASHSYITRYLAEGVLKLPKLSYSRVLTGDSEYIERDEKRIGDPRIGELRANHYCDILIGNKIKIDFLELTETGMLDENNMVGILIGMDVIGLGDLVISNHGKTVIPFRYPSCGHLNLEL